MHQPGQIGNIYPLQLMFQTAYISYSYPISITVHKNKEVVAAVDKHTFSCTPQMILTSREEGINLFTLWLPRWMAMKCVAMSVQLAKG